MQPVEATDGTRPARAATTSAEQAEAWVRGFARGWDSPASPEDAVARFEPILSPEMRFVQPQLPDLVGMQEGLEGFWRPLFALLPDVRIDVQRWAVNGDDLFIEHRIGGTLGGRPVAFKGADVIRLREGIAVERIAHADPLPILLTVARRPRAWPAFLRYQAALLRFRRRRR